VSDLHLDGEARAADRAARVFTYLGGLPGPVDALLVSGDIADHGLTAEYEEAAKLFADVPYPVLVLPGNHDVRAPFREVLLGTAGSGEPVNQVREVGGAVFALCDSSIPGRNDGLLSDETIDWLDSSLTASSGRPSFVCFHHPPAELGSYADTIRQFGEERLAEVVRRHPDVVALLCGHVHTAAATTFAGRPLLMAPGVVSTGRMPWQSGDGFVDLDQPPGLAFHVLHDERRLTTHYRVAL
jgi:3',5'-cyclic AMP phosphodiesterase CpdA